MCLKVGGRRGRRRWEVGGGRWEEGRRHREKAEPSHGGEEKNSQDSSSIAKRRKNMTWDPLQEEVAKGAREKAGF